MIFFQSYFFGKLDMCAKNFNFRMYNGSKTAKIKFPKKTRLEKKKFFLMFIHQNRTKKKFFRVSPLSMRI